MADEHLASANNRIEDTRQWILSLSRLNDRKQGAHMIADLVLRHAPSLAPLAAEQIQRVLLDCPERRAALAKLNSAQQATSSTLFSHIRLTPVEEQAEAFTLLVDPELYRVWIALGYGIQFTLWAVAREISKRHGGAGWVEITELVDTLKEQGIVVKPYTIKRHWIRNGVGLFWRQHQGRLYLFGYQELCKRAVDAAFAAGLPDLVSTNPPGAKFMVIPLGTKPIEFYAYALAAWHNSRGNHTQNISRVVLEALWNVSKKTLITWEKEIGIDVTKCYAVYTDTQYLPAKHAYPTLHVVGTPEGGTDIEVRATARHSNIYHAPTMKEHQHKRTPREARRIARLAIDDRTHDGIRNGIYGQPEAQADGVAILPTKRRNFYANDGDLPGAFKRLVRHTRQHDEQAPHFVAVEYNGRRDRWTFEQSSDGIQRTKHGDRLPRRLEDFYFAQNGGRGAYVAAWRGITL